MQWNIILQKIEMIIQFQFSAGIDKSNFCEGISVTCQLIFAIK